MSRRPHSPSKLRPPRQHQRTRPAPRNDRAAGAPGSYTSPVAEPGGIELYAAASTLAPASAIEKPRRGQDEQLTMWRAIGHVQGLQDVWHLVDVAALDWLVSEVAGIPAELLTPKVVRNSLVPLLDDRQMPDVLRATIAQLAVGSGAVPAVGPCTSRHFELRTAASLSTTVSP